MSFLRCIFSIITAFAIAFAACAQASAETIRVGKDQRIASIKEAISIASNGDTILVLPGTYREGNIVIEKSLTIVGMGSPVLDGESRYEIFTVHSKSVTIQGIKFAHTGISSLNDIAAIKVLDSESLHIIDNQFEETFFGIHVSNSSQVWIERNVLKNSQKSEHQIGNGIHLWKCHHITVDKNTVTGHRDGIYFEFVTNSLITNNRSSENMRYGLHFMFSHNDEYRGNTFLENGAGVAVMYTAGVKMIDNVFEKNWGASSYGLLLKDIRDSEVRANKFISNSVGIHMEGSSRIEFSQNTFHSNGYGIRLQASCDDNVLTNNNFTANTFDMTTNGSLVLNKVNHNYWDRYDGYDLNRDGIGDLPYHPVSMYSMVVEQIPTAVLLWRSFLVFLMDRAEKAMPAITPQDLKDDTPLMKPYDIDKQPEQIVWKAPGS